jgi:ribonuclease HI
MYTDGSALKAQGGKFYCGAGVVLIYGERVKEISHEMGYATVNIAELTAPILGLNMLKSPCKVTIYSDSQYTIDTQTKYLPDWLRRGWRTSTGKPVKNKELIKELYQLSKIHDIEWVKVKGHSGDAMNDLADKLACEASAAVKEKLKESECQ